MARIKESLVEKERKREELGFGTKVTNTQARLVNPDGDFNVRKVGQSFTAQLNIYNRLIMMPWARFFWVTLVFYFTVNLIFGIGYYFIGMEHLAGIDPDQGISEFWEAFFFSSQTLTTVGYGKISPIGYQASLLAAVEALVGLMIFAIMTGLLYGRFSRPNPKILYANTAVIAPYFDINGFMFRMANQKSNQLINLEVNIMFSRNETVDGEIKRKYYNLELERTKVKFFPTAWTVVHPITKDSILLNETQESLKASDAEFIIAVEGIDDTLTDPIHSRTSYLYDMIEWGAKYVNMLDVDGDSYVLDLSKISNFEKVELNKTLSE